MKKALMTLGGLLLAGSLIPEGCEAGNPFNVWSAQHGNNQAWHGNHYYLPYGQPTAVVVPPNTYMRQTYSWGVSQNLMYPQTSRFGRNATSPGALPPGSFQPTPQWPSHTDQFGLYYVRAPW
jgi:hypothetical protein